MSIREYAFLFFVRALLRRASFFFHHLLPIFFISQNFTFAEYDGVGNTPLFCDCLLHFSKLLHICYNKGLLESENILTKKYKAIDKCIPLIIK